MKKKDKQKKIYLVIGTLLIIILLAVLFIFFTKEKPIDKVEEEHIIVSEFGGAPFYWRYEVDNKNIAQLKETRVISESDEGTDGGESKIEYIFEGLKKGKTTIKFESYDFVNDEVDETIVYEVQVDKDLNVKIFKLVYE